MIKYLTLIFFAVNTTTTSIGKSIIKSDYVFICNGPKSKVYHRTISCKGLSRCSTEIQKTTTQIAIKKGRRECRIEY